MDTQYYIEGKYKDGTDFFEGFFTSVDSLIKETNARNNEELKYPVTVFEQVENYRGDTITKPMFNLNK